jgi:hypothetical protein
MAWHCCPDRSRLPRLCLSDPRKRQQATRVLDRRTLLELSYGNTKEHDWQSSVGWQTVHVSDHGKGRIRVRVRSTKKRHSPGSIRQWIPTGNCWLCWQVAIKLHKTCSMPASTKARYYKIKSSSFTRKSVSIRWLALLQMNPVAG